MNWDKSHLIEYLSLLDIQTEDFGQGQSKTILHLLSELNNMECSLNGAIRHIHTVCFDVFYKNLKLREACQVFNDGRIRIRKFSFGAIGEKLRLGENAQTGLIRGLKEELNIDYSYGVRINSVGTNILISPSNSYPGLVTINTQALFNVTIPKRFYKEDGYFKNQSDKTTYFDWVLR